MSKYPKTLGRIEAVWNKLGGEEGVDRFLRGELTVSETPRKWFEQDGVIYLSVTSDGTVGPEWMRRIRRSGFHLGEFTHSMFTSRDFKPSNGVTTKVAILKGTLFEDKDRTAENILAEAHKRKLSTPKAEVACLIRVNFSDEEIEAMGLFSIVTMHEEIESADDIPSRFCVDRHFLDEDGSSSFAGDRGFAFVVPAK